MIHLEGNPLIKFIRNVPYEFSIVCNLLFYYTLHISFFVIEDLKPDFECSTDTGVLFLSMRYHKLHPAYIETRVSDLSKYNLKVFWHFYSLGAGRGAWFTNPPLHCLGVVTPSWCWRAVFFTSGLKYVLLPCRSQFGSLLHIRRSGRIHRKLQTLREKESRINYNGQSKTEG